MYDSALQGCCGGLGAVGYAELHEDVPDVGLGGVFGEGELIGNLLVAETFYDEAKNLQLAIAQFGTRDSCGHACGYGRWYEALALVNSAHRFHQFGTRCAL